MSKIALGIVIGAVLLFAAPAFAVDGVVLINQSTVMAQGGFPYKITQPGSYKLSGNLVVTTAIEEAIEIISDDVTLDLNGFSISCNGSCAGQAILNPCAVSIYSSGIKGFGNNTTITNGSIRGFRSGFGVEMNGTGGLLSDLRVMGNENGIASMPCSYSAAAIIPVHGFVITRCYGIGNSNAGIAAAQSTVTDSVANNNGNAGFDDLGGGSVFINNVANGNGIGLETSNDLYGGNNFNNNGINVNNLGGSVSQNNNSCNGTVC
jgi:hypothetical protein